MRDTTNIKIKYRKVKRCLDTFRELPLTGVLPSRDSKIKGAKTNTILKRPINKLFPIENTYQDTDQTGTAREQKSRREAAVIGEIKRKYEC